MRKLATISTLALFSTAAAPAAAQSYTEEDTGFYIEGGAGYMNFEPEGAEEGIDTTTLNARAGYQFTRNFSFELDLASGIDDGEFDFNTDEDEFDLDDNDDGDFDDLIAASGDVGLNYLVGAFARASVPVTDSVDLYGRLGYALVDLDATVMTPGGAELATVEGDEDGAAIGGGAIFDITESWSIRADGTYYAFDNTDTFGAGLTLGYKF